MGKARTTAVAVVLGSLIAAGSSPASAAAGDPLVVSSTGLADGQAVGLRSRFFPVWTEGAEITQVAVFKNGKLLYTTTNWAAGLRLPLTPVEDGTGVLVTVRAYDAAGAWAEASTTVLADETSPTASFSPAGGTLEHGVFTVTASGVSADVAEIALVATGDVKLATATAAPWTITYDSAGGPGGVNLAVTDRAGNVRKYTGYLIDNISPGIANPTFFGHPQGRVRGWSQIDVQFSDSSGVNHDEWRVDGELVQSQAPLTDPGESYSGSTLTYDFGVRQRTATLQVLARDRAGNEATKTFTVIVDATGPSITSVTPTNGTLVRGRLVYSSVRAIDPAGISSATLDWNWSGYRSPFTSSILAGADGRRTFTWRVYDQLNNASTITRYVVVDNTRPTLKITKAPKNKAKVKGTVKVSVSATDRNGVSRVELLINGKIVATDVRTGYTFSIKTKKYGKKLRVQLRAYDRAGNVTTTATRTWHR